MIVAELEDKVPQAVDAADEPVLIRRFFSDDLTDIVCIVVVKDVDAARGDFQQHGIRGLRTVWRLNVHGG